MNKKEDKREKKRKNIGEFLKNNGIRIMLLFFILSGLFVFFPLEKLPTLLKSGKGYVGNVVISVFIEGSRAPDFLHNLSNQTVNEGIRFIYDVNCSDPDPLDTVTYLDNSSLFTIDSSTGIFNWTPNETYVGVNSFLITCTDGSNSSSNNIHINVIDINLPPVLNAIGDLFATENELFTKQLKVYEPDGDTVIFAANNTVIINISNLTGLINFTPTLAQTGARDINFSVTDGVYTDSEVVLFTIYRAPYCGDGSCAGIEDCATCATDCGACPGAPATSTGQAGAAAAGQAAAAGTASQVIQQFGVCIERWSCTQWAQCSIQGVQARKCFDLNACGTTKRKPEEVRECVYQSTCADGVRNGQEEGVDCGGSCPSCESKIESGCFDSIQNNGETGIDCGGPCTPCLQKLFAKLPTIEKARLIEIVKKQFPWFLILLMCILLILLLSTDQIYVNYLKKSEFAEYRSKYRRYKPKRVKLYKFVLHTMAITFAISWYMYAVSDDWSKFMEYLWVLIFFLIVIPVSLTLMFNHLEYREHRKIKKEEKMRQNHKMQQWNFIMIEDRSLLKLESMFLEKIEKIIAMQELASLPQIKEKLEEVRLRVAKIRDARSVKAQGIEFSQEMKDEIAGLFVDTDLLAMAKAYPEFADIFASLKALSETLKKKGDLILPADSYANDMQDIAKDKQLVSVCQSSQNLIELYNRLVDIYIVCNGFFQNHEAKEKELLVLEKDLVSLIEDISSNAAMTKFAEENRSVTRVYNLFIDLYNQYQKRIELVTEFGNVK